MSTPIRRIGFVGWARIQVIARLESLRKEVIKPRKHR